MPRRHKIQENTEPKITTEKSNSFESVELPINPIEPISKIPSFSVTESVPKIPSFSVPEPQDKSGMILVNPTKNLYYTREMIEAEKLNQLKSLERKAEILKSRVIEPVVKPIETFYISPKSVQKAPNRYDDDLENILNAGLKYTQ